MTFNFIRLGEIVIKSSSGFILILVLIVLLSHLSGCSPPDGREFSGLLSSNRVDRIVIIDDARERTNVLTEDAVIRLLERLSATNRIANPIRRKSYSSGYVKLWSGGQYLGTLAYFPEEQVLAYRDYEFRFRDTNDIASLFR
jgi:hypothetical protein